MNTQCTAIALQWSDKFPAYDELIAESYPGDIVQVMLNLTEQRFQLQEEVKAHTAGFDTASGREVDSYALLRFFLCGRCPSVLTQSSRSGL